MKKHADIGLKIVAQRVAAACLALEAEDPIRPGLVVAACRQFCVAVCSHLRSSLEFDISAFEVKVALSVLMSRAFERTDLDAQTHRRLYPLAELGSTGWRACRTEARKGTFLRLSHVIGMRNRSSSKMCWPTSGVMTMLPFGLVIWKA